MTAINFKLKTLPLMSIAICMCFAGCSSDGPDTPYEPIPFTRTEQEIVGQGNDLGYKMLRATYSPGLNTVESPLSLSFALGMLANGAQDATLDQILELNGAESLDDLNSCMGKVLKNLRGADSKVDLRIANSLWLDKGFNATEEFRNAVKSGYNADFFTEQLNTEATMKKINKWCSKKTNGMITDFLKEKLKDSDDMALYNAMYFKGEWTKRFDPKDTKDKFFHNATGRSSKVPMMYKTEGLNGYRSDEYSKCVRVPYGNGNFYMELELPAKDKSVQEVIKARLDGKRPESVTVTEIKLTLPRFKVLFEFNVSETLKNMGYDAINDMQGYTLISGSAPGMSHIKQMAVIEVDENGTKAAVVTGNGELTAARPMPVVELVFDRPFLYYIREATTGATLFCGVINNL